MRVLVTRPQNEAVRWVRDLRQRGFDAQAFPLIDIAPAADPAVLQAKWQQLERFRAVMFVSGNAVRHFFLQRPTAAGWPARTRAWSSGGGTRAALIGAGLSGAQIDSPAPQARQFDSETLWQQVASQVVTGDRVLIVRGGNDLDPNSGRDWLADQLAAAGARVEFAAAYLRRPPELSEQQLTQAREAAVDGSVWLFSSSQAIAYLQALMPLQDWARARAICTHAHIAQSARLAGFDVVCESRPVLDAVAAALESFR